MKKIIAIILCVMTSILFCAGCFGSATVNSDALDEDILDGYTPNGTLTIWSFTDELGDVADMFAAKYPDVTIDFTCWSYDTLAQKLTPLLSAGSSVAPDIMGLSTNFASVYIDSPWLADISCFVDDMEAIGAPQGLIDYGQDSDGNLRAVSYQASFNGIYYRTDLAEKYFGTSDRDVIQEKLKDNETLKVTAQELLAASDGVCKLFGSVDVLVNDYTANREYGWVDEDNNFQIAPGFDTLLEDCKEYRDNGYEAKFEGSGTEYPASYVDGVANTEIFCYRSGTFWKEYYLKEVATGANADYMDKYTFVEGTGLVCSGGTYTGMNANAKDQQLAASFMKFIASDEQFYRDWADQTGDVVASKTVVSDYAADDSKIDANFGVNIYAMVEDYMDDIDFSNITQYDADISDLFYDTLNKYLTGSYTIDQAIANFKSDVSTNIRAINVT